MKKIVAGLVLVILLGVMLIGGGNVYAMNNESAAMLAGAIAIFGKPIMNAIATEIYYPPVYSAYPVATKVIYTPTPSYSYGPCYRPRSAYDRGYCEEQLRIEREELRREYRRGRRDAKQYYYGY